MDKFLNPEEFNINNIFNGKYNIPIYQRPYSWEETEVRQLLGDIEYYYNIYSKHINNETEIDNQELLMFTGTLFIKFDKNVKNTYTEYDIVDGQQRITTFTLLLMAILNYFYQQEIEEDTVVEIENYLWKKIDRKRNKEIRVLTLGNIDRNIMSAIFDELYSKKDIITFSKNQLKEEINDIEKNLLQNLIIIHEYLSNILVGDDYFTYFEYIKYNIKFISIEVRTNLTTLFGIFESINSKGKPLDEIDLIKSYIFQNINEAEYDEYLRKWGNLIIKTNDNLMDYLTVYIRANISYYRNSIKLLNFKALIDGNFKEYFMSSNTHDTMICLIDDLTKNVKYYNMLSDFTALHEPHHPKKLQTYLIMNRIAEYKHNRALFYKLLMLYDKNNLDLDVLINIVEYAFKFILTYQSVSSRESKNTLGVFVDVQNIIYKYIYTYDNQEDLSTLKFDNILSTFNKRIIDSAINTNSLRSSLKTSMTYGKNKKIVKVLLSYLEYTNCDYFTDYEKLFWLLKIGKDIHIDHILPLSPEKNDNNFEYYVEYDSVILKENQDFITPPIQFRYGKSEFYDKFLHKIGNLRLQWASDNIKKSNSFITINEFDNAFNTYSRINSRTDSLIQNIIDSGILLSSESVGDVSLDNYIDETISVNDFCSNISYQNFKPVSYVFFDDHHTLGRYTYAHLLNSVMNMLFELDESRFNEIALDKFCLTASNRIYVSTDKSDIKRPYEVSKNIFVEQNLSAEYIMKFIYAILTLFNLSKNDLVITLSEK